MRFLNSGSPYSSAKAGLFYTKLIIPPRNQRVLTTSFLYPQGIQNAA